MVSGTWLAAVRTWGADIAVLVTVTLGRAWSSEADADADVGVDGEADSDPDSDIDPDADVEAAILIRVTLGLSRLVGGWVDTFGLASLVGCTQSVPLSLGGEKIRAGYTFQFLTLIFMYQGGTIL